MMQAGYISDGTRDVTHYNVLRVMDAPHTNSGFIVSVGVSSEEFNRNTRVCPVNRDSSSNDAQRAEDQRLTRLFADLVNQWKTDTAIMSSVSHKARHPAYQRIIGMGPSAIPLILEELRQNPNDWFWALNALTGENPVPEEARGRISAMVKAWLEWGRENRYIA